MVLQLNKDIVRTVEVPSDLNDILIERMEIDKIEEALFNDQYVVVDVDDNSMKSVLTYMYIMYKQGLMSHPNAVDAYHYTIIKGGLVDHYNSHLVAAGQRFKLKEDDENYMPVAPTFDLVNFDWNTEEGRLKYISVFALCLASLDRDDERATVYVKIGTDLPYIFKYVANVLAISEETYNSAIAKSTEE